MVNMTLFMLGTMGALAVFVPSQGAVAEELGTNSRFYPLPDSIGSLTVTQAQEQCDAQAENLIKGTLSAAKTREVLAICSLAGPPYKDTYKYSNLTQEDGSPYFPELIPAYNKTQQDTQDFLNNRRTSGPLMLYQSA